MNDDRLTNTGSSRMTAAFYNEMRKMEVEDVRDDDTLRLVSLVPMVASAAETAPLPSPSQAFAAALHGDEGRPVDSLAEPLLALTLWQERMVEV